MEKESLKSLTHDQLKQRLVILKSITWSLSIVLLLLFCITLYKSFAEGKTQVLIVVPLALSSMLVFNFIIIKKLDTEIKARKQGENLQ